MLGFSRFRRTGLLATIALTLASWSTARADFAYIGYYHSQQVTQLTIGSGSNTAITGGTTFASGFAPEMITSLTNLPGTNSSQLFIVNTSGGSVESFTPGGTLISSNILKDANGNTITLGGMAGATLSANGQDYYVAASNSQGVNASGGSTASGIYEFSTTTGREVGFTAFTGAHDITFHNGYVYATAYQATGTTTASGGTPLPNAANGGVWQFSADLTSGSQIIAPKGTPGSTPTGINSNNLYNATGMTFVGNNLYVGNASINNGISLSSFVQEYTLAYGTNTTASYVTTFSSAANIVNPFGLTTGPDGNVYISSLGDIPSGGSNPGQITELNVSTGVQSVYLAMGSDNAGQAPKYLTFASESTVFVPEPGSFVLMGLGLAGVGVIGRFRNRTNKVVA